VKFKTLGAWFQKHYAKKHPEAMDKAMKVERIVPGERAARRVKVVPVVPKLQLRIKEKRHPTGMIDLTIVPFSSVADDVTKDQYKIPRDHHVLVVDMGECK